MPGTQKKPYIVQTVAGSYCGEYDTAEQAASSAADRNTRAEDLGVQARYESKER